MCIGRCAGLAPFSLPSTLTDPPPSPHFTWQVTEVKDNWADANFPDGSAWIKLTRTMRGLQWERVLLKE